MKAGRRFIRIGKDVVMPIMVSGQVTDEDGMMSAVMEWVKEKHERLFRVGMSSAKDTGMQVADTKIVGKTQYRLWTMPLEVTVTVLTKESGDDGKSYRGFKVTPQTLHVLVERQISETR